jgi:hypothetical protein
MRYYRGRASDRGFNHKALKYGAKVEKKEHRVPWPMATKIARDHLYEDRNYYKKLRRCGL